MIGKITRVVRTPYSERFVLQDSNQKDFGALDLHYTASGKVTGTLILFGNVREAEQQVPEILKSIDEILLPDVSIADGNLSFTVIKGEVIGNFRPEPDQ